ncbi:BA14K family protein [Rhodoplanes azumiensis]|uniref:Lectin-like protein BA14k n=1 Tax=Rhodoplanes azumiensis TaxID=1897628 RepID=A0ABW5ALV1_9BRAD
MISTKMKLASGVFALCSALVLAAPQAEAQRWGGRGWHGGGWHGGPGHHHRHGGWGRGAAAGIAGFATGAIIGGALASQPNYYGGYAAAPGYGGGDADAVAYCRQRFKSYDPTSGTYLGYDGNRHACP